MTEEELAEEYAKLNARQYIHNDGCGFCTSEEEVKQAFLAGLKAKTQWHDLRKNPKDLPDSNRDVLIVYEDCEDYPSIGYFSKRNEGWLEYPDEDDVYETIIAWCELPIFKGESL